MKDSIKVPEIARWFVGKIRARPWIALLVGFAIMGGLLPGMKGLKANFTYRGYFYPDDPMLLDFDKFERQFGNDDAVVVALHSPSGIFDVESSTVLRGLTEDMWQVPEIIRVDSLFTYSWVHATGDDLTVEPFLPDEGPLDTKVLAERAQIAKTHEVLPRYLISDDGKTALVFGTCKPHIEQAVDAPVVINAVRKLVAKYQTGDHQLYVSGGPAVTTGFKEVSIGDASTLYPLAFLLTLIFLAVLLRSPIGVALALAVVFPAIFATLGMMGYAGVELTNITFVVPQILLAIGVADSVHVLVSFYRALGTGMARKDAAEYALLKNFMPTILTSITTAVGFFSLTSASLKPVVGLGLSAGFGSLMAWLYTYLLLGAAIFIIPISRSVLSPDRAGLARERATRLTDWMSRNRTALLGGYGAVCLIGAALAVNNTVNSDPFNYFREGYPLRVANDFVEQEVGGARGCEISVNAGADEGIKDPAFLRKVEALQAWIEEMPDVSKAISIVDIIKMTNRSLHGDDPAQLVIPDDKMAIAQELMMYTLNLPQGMSLNDRVTIKNDAVRMTVLWAIHSSAEVDRRIALIQDKAKSLGLDVVVTGKNRIWQSMNGYVVWSFIASLSIAFVAISLILVVFFRSLGLGLLAMVPNSIPLLIGGGVLFLIGKPLDVGVSLVMSVCLGIAVDDTIHVLSNYKRLRSEGKTPRLAVIDILAETGPALITTSVILVSSFGIFVFGTFVPNLYFGLMVAVILGVALITDLTFLPALLLRRSKG